MAIVSQTIMDSRWKTIMKFTFSGTQTNSKIVDVSTLVGYVDDTSIVNLAAVNWSVNGGSVLLEWDQVTAICYLDGNGKFGGANGFTAFPNNRVANANRGDIHFTNSITSQGFLVLVMHKVEAVVGQGGGWSN